MSYIQTYVEKINENIHLKALKLAIVDLLSVIIAGCLILWVNCYFKWQPVNEAGILFCAYFPILLSVSYGYHYAKENKLSVVETMSFDFMFIFFVSYFGKISLLQGFLPILLGIFVLNSLIKLIKKLPILVKGLPQGANDYFQNIICLCINFIVTGLLIYVTIQCFPFLIKGVQGIINALNSICGILVVVLVTVFFWSTGLHGVAFISTLLRPFWLQMLLLNMVQILTSQTPLFIATEPFYQWFIWIGGSGTTLGLVILMRYFSKSQHLRNLGKGALKSGLVNINEQVIFGIPIVLNKIMMIPFYLAPCLCAIISYFYLSQHPLMAPSFAVPWIFPFILGGFISSGGQLSILGLLILLLIVSIVVYLPFFIYYDRKLKQNEER